MQVFFSHNDLTLDQCAISLFGSTWFHRSGATSERQRRSYSLFPSFSSCFWLRCGLKLGPFILMTTPGGSKRSTRASKMTSTGSLKGSVYVPISSPGPACGVLERRLQQKRGLCRSYPHRVVGHLFCFVKMIVAGRSAPLPENIKSGVTDRYMWLILLLNLKLIKLDFFCQ